MPQRLRYPEVAPEGYAALSAFGHYIHTATTLEPVLKGLIDLRASQINGCEFCIAMHRAELRKHHEPDTRIDAVAGWRGCDAFTPRERAALAWTEVLTNLPAGSHASDEDFAAVSEFFREKDLVDLTYAIANINAWNRLGVAFRPAFHAKPAEEATQSAVGDDGAKVAEE
jgi:AhpD family alkylhydroperoxidase